MSDVHKRHPVAIVLHVYYPELWPEFERALESLAERFDLYVTMPTDLALTDAVVRRGFPEVSIHRCENRGRDIAPFLTVMSSILPLSYEAVCKLHTKRSLNVTEEGDRWRIDMVEKLVGQRDAIARVRRAFTEHPEWSMIAPAGHVVPRELYWQANASRVSELAKQIGFDATEPFSFVAGSMFWVRPDVLRPLATAGITTANFEPESGARDGTLAHALERLFGLLVSGQGRQIAEISPTEIHTSQVPFHLKLLAERIDPPQIAAEASPSPPPPPAVSIQAVRDAHQGQTAWIVGKGPSLANVGRRHFGPGPVIALNEAILAVEFLGLDNPVYSMQKDADAYGLDANHFVAVQGTSEIPLRTAALLVHAHESPNRMPYYSPRFVFDNEADFGLPWWEFSSLVSIAVARLMGCDRLVYVSHDACVTGDTRSCEPTADGRFLIVPGMEEYLQHRARIEEYLAKSGMPASWLTPEDSETERRRAATESEAAARREAAERAREVAEAARDRHQAALERAESTIARDAARIAGLEEQCRDLTRHLQQVLASASWRWTAPLRAIMDAYLRMKG